jgi:hypothetical protein
MQEAVAGIEIFDFVDFTGCKFCGRDSRTAWLVLEFAAHLPLDPVKTASAAEADGLQAILERYRLQRRFDRSQDVSF